MIILAIDTSGPNCSVAIVDEQKVIANSSINIGKTHSETLLPLVDELLQFAQLDLKDIDVLACCIGPGSFTGIRIGIATVKGFALSLNKPVISVSTLESIAYNIPQFDGMICSILNANHDNVYAALYKQQETLTQIGDYYTDSIDILIEAVTKQKQKVLFVGDGAIFYQEKIKQVLHESAVFVPQHFNEQSAISVARVALDKFKRNELDNVDALHPLYLRKSQAERMAEEA